jgi:hypothetical protein
MVQTAAKSVSLQSLINLSPYKGSQFYQFSSQLNLESSFKTNNFTVTNSDVNSQSLLGKKFAIQKLNKREKKNILKGLIDE